MLPAPKTAPGQSQAEKYPATTRHLRRWNNRGGQNAKYGTVWTDEMREAVLVRFENGATISEIILLMGISRQTFYNWINAEGKEDFTQTINVGVNIAKAWWINRGREALGDKGFNARVYEFMLRNLYGWTGINPQDSLPPGSAGTEGEEVAGVRDTVDVQEIIRMAKEHPIEVEYEVVPNGKEAPEPEPEKEEAPKEQVAVRKKKAGKKRTKAPPKPKGLKKENTDDRRQRQRDGNRQGAKKRKKKAARGRSKKQTRVQGGNR